MVAPTLQTNAACCLTCRPKKKRRLGIGHYAQILNIEKYIIFEMFSNRGS
jgi:hypothetical protein